MAKTPIAKSTGTKIASEIKNNIILYYDKCTDRNLSLKKFLLMKGYTIIQVGTGKTSSTYKFLLPSHRISKISNIG